MWAPICLRMHTQPGIFTCSPLLENSRGYPLYFLSPRRQSRYRDRLRSEITSATAVLVVIGPRWLETLNERHNQSIDQVGAEVRFALESGNSVIPVVVGNAVMPTAADLAGLPDLLPLVMRNGRAVRPDPHFDGDLAQIISHLETFDVGEAIGT